MFLLPLLATLVWAEPKAPANVPFEWDFRGLTNLEGDAVDVVLDGQDLGPHRLPGVAGMTVARRLRIQVSDAGVEHHLALNYVTNEGGPRNPQPRAAHLAFIHRPGDDAWYPEGAAPTPGRRMMTMASTPEIAALKRCRLAFRYNDGEITGIVESPWPEVSIEDRPLKSAKDYIEGVNHFWRRCDGMPDWHTQGPKQLENLNARELLITRMTAGSREQAQADVMKALETHGGIKPEPRRDPTGLLGQYKWFTSAGDVAVDGQKAPLYCDLAKGPAKCLLAFFPPAAPSGGRYVYYAFRFTDIYIEDLFLIPFLNSLHFEPKAQERDAKGSATTLELWARKQVRPRG